MPRLRMFPQYEGSTSSENYVRFQNANILEPFKAFPGRRTSLDVTSERRAHWTSLQNPSVKDLLTELPGESAHPVDRTCPDPRRRLRVPKTETSAPRTLEFGPPPAGKEIRSNIWHASEFLEPGPRFAPNSHHPVAACNQYRQQNPTHVGEMTIPLDYVALNYIEGG